MAKDKLEKKLFIEAIKLLGEIEDRRDFMEEELGVDMTVYEEKFLTIIENLFKIHFNNEQIALVQYYIYQVPSLQDFSGKLSIPNGEDSLIVDFETPEDLWEVIVLLKK